MMGNSSTANQIGIHLRQALLFVLLVCSVLCRPANSQEAVSVAFNAKKPSRNSLQSIANKIDLLVEEKLASEGLNRNKRSSDSVFLRRVYLDIVGRIPNLEETQTFLNSKNKSKRANLIDELLDSYGRTSRQFNFWADLLRIKSKVGNGLSGQPYIEFVKDSLQKNQPYDEFVQEMLTALGSNLAHDNGEVGYYLRDRNMPEDNMSNTVRVFLGTRLECAQCHDHPYDEWTQRQYFEMVAFTGGISFRNNNSNTKELQKLIRNAEVPEKIRGKISKFTKALNAGISGSGTGLARLPENFQGTDGADGEIVVAREMFEGTPITEAEIPSRGNSKKNAKKRNKRQKGRIRGVKEIGSREVYAAWLTDPENPRFATVIANRLWKQAMGIGLIEPVDIIEEGTEGSNPALMEYLAETMIDLDFDMKEFQRVIYLSETYQASAFTNDVPDVTKYNFQGPIVRRMSAEQIWDSLLSLVVAEIDVRQTNMSGNQYVSPEQYEKLLEMTPAEIIEFATQAAEKNGKGNKDSFKQMKKKELHAKQREFKKQLRTAQKAKDSVAVKELMLKRAQFVSELRRNQPQFTRASELRSPAPARHFLREFGQSDREVIDNANSEPSVPQVLSMMNGILEKSVCRDRNSLLMQQAMQATSSQERVETVFLTMLSRKPSRQELNTWRPDFDAAPQQNQNAMMDTFSDLIWTIANSNEFIFQK